MKLKKHFHGSTIHFKKEIQKKHIKHSHTHTFIHSFIGVTMKAQTNPINNTLPKRHTRPQSDGKWKTPIGINAQMQQHSTNAASNSNINMSTQNSNNSNNNYNNYNNNNNNNSTMNGTNTNNTNTNANGTNIDTTNTNTNTNTNSKRSSKRQQQSQLAHLIRAYEEWSMQQERTQPLMKATHNANTTGIRQTHVHAHYPFQSHTSPALLARMQHMFQQQINADNGGQHSPDTNHHGLTVATNAAIAGIRSASSEFLYNSTTHSSSPSSTGSATPFHTSRSSSYSSNASGNQMSPLHTSTPAHNTALLPAELLSLTNKTYNKDKLSEFIANRPSFDELRQRNNVVQDTMMWSRQVCNGSIPLPRNCHAMVHTANSNFLYLLGGYGTGSTVLELLTLNLSTFSWQRPLIGGLVPVERYSHSVVCVGTQLIVFGGFSVHSQWLNDLHVLDTEYVQPFYPKLQPSASMNMLMWYTPQTVSGIPPCPRAAHTATAIDQKIYIFAGNDGSMLFNDLHCLDLSTMTWECLETHGETPAPRAGHSCTAILGHDGWKLVVFGGGTASGPVNDLHIFDVNSLTWSDPRPYGTPPAPRAGHTTTGIFNNQLLVFGGGYVSKVYNDLHVYHLDSNLWSRPSDAGSLPSPRAGHTCLAVDSTQLFIFGGGDADDVFNDLHCLDTTFCRLNPNVQHLTSPSDAAPTARPLPVSVGNNEVDVKIFKKSEENLMLEKLRLTATQVRSILNEAMTELEQHYDEHKRMESELLAWMRVQDIARRKEYDSLKGQIESLNSVVAVQLSELREFIIERKPMNSTLTSAAEGLTTECSDISVDSNSLESLAPSFNSASTNIVDSPNNLSSPDSGSI